MDSIHITTNTLAFPTCRQCRYNTQQPLVRFRPVTPTFTPLLTLRHRRLRSRINRVITSPIRALLNHREMAASVAHHRVDPALVPHLRLKDFPAPTAARHLRAMTCFDDILQERLGRFLSLRSIDRRAATNAQDPRQDAISRSPLADDVVPEESSVSTLHDPVTLMFERQGTPAPCPIWTLRCTR